MNAGYFDPFMFLNIMRGEDVKMETLRSQTNHYNKSRQRSIGTISLQGRRRAGKLTTCLFVKTRIGENLLVL
ncbi:unnamed protein product [Arabis nemorensis]|uniref:Uncharacterized protein n=1 Tax=Arabis nemorensis TaxID=586526 RepID=A0A565CTQ4_9BRAS|nr:unnamed protein product [Arabis nemorensis]